MENIPSTLSSKPLIRGEESFSVYIEYNKLYAQICAKQCAEIYASASSMEIVESCYDRNRRKVSPFFHSDLDQEFQRQVSGER